MIFQKPSGHGREFNETGEKLPESVEFRAALGDKISMGKAL
jgi:hypothetical protein